jgi:EAL domain-containing protein (putative c-di-GMP-specific phosphodiesterase class I)
LYSAKKSGRNCAVVYEDSLAAEDRLREDVAAGLRRGEFELYYQPVVELSTLQIVSFEALIRWNRPGHGLFTPGHFLDLIEQTDQICDLDRWALNRACSTLAAWRTAGAVGEHVKVAVNLSGRHAANPDVVGDVKGALQRSGLPAGRLQVELTETVLCDTDVVRDHLAMLCALGVGVAIDDFGAGYMSVRQLAGLPADTLKIDQTFIADLMSGQSALVGVMIEAGHAFGMNVVAEGVEHQTHVEALQQLGCDRLQGYLVSRPMPAEQVPSWSQQSITLDPPAPDSASIARCPGTSR